MPMAIPDTPRTTGEDVNSDAVNVIALNDKKLDALRAEACSLLGISEEMSAEERADSHAREAEFRAWREEKAEGMPSLVDHGQCSNMSYVYLLPHV